MKTKVQVCKCAILVLLLGVICTQAVFANDKPFFAAAYIMVIDHPQESGLHTIPRRSVSTLMESEPFLNNFLNKSKIANTKWFQGFGGNGPSEKLNGIRDLQKFLQVKTVENTNLIEISLSNTDPEEAVLIVNELINLFVEKQREISVEQIQKQLVNLKIRGDSLQSELSAADKSLDQVCEQSGYTDLERGENLHPVEDRLIRLQRIKDEIVIAIEVNKAKGDKDEKSVITAKLNAVERMLEEVKSNKRTLDHARVEYKRRTRIRRQIEKMSNSIKTQIEQLKTQASDPDIAGIRIVAEAASLD